MVGFIFNDNIISNGTYGLTGTALSGTASVLPANADTYAWLKNVVIGGDSGEMAGTGTNYVPANVAAVGFTNVGTGDYSLSGASAYKNVATDGLDPGCDITALNAAIAGVV